MDTVSILATVYWQLRSLKCWGMTALLSGAPPSLSSSLTDKSKQVSDRGTTSAIITALILKIISGNLLQPINVSTSYSLVFFVFLSVQPTQLWVLKMICCDSSLRKPFVSYYIGSTLPQRSLCAMVRCAQTITWMEWMTNVDSTWAVQKESIFKLGLDWTGQINLTIVNYGFTATFTKH